MRLLGSSAAGIKYDETDGCKRLQQLQVPDFYAMIAKKAQIAFESASLPAFRLNLAGSRQLLACRFSEVGEYARAKIGGRALRHPVNSHATTQNG